MWNFNGKTIASLAMFAAVGCGDSPSGPDIDMQASVQGRVEETTPPPSGASQSAPQQTPATDAQTVAVVHVRADGSFTELATAEVGADASFTVEGVPAGWGDLAVVAYADGTAVGSVLIHDESRPGATIRAAPIDYETTLEARAYSKVRATGGASASGSAELALFIHGDRAATEAAASSEAEISAAASAYTAARATVTAAYEARGKALDATARGELMAEAAVEFASRRLGGMSLTAAHELFTEAAIDALVGAEADLESTVLASAAAATVFDASLEGTSSLRGDLVVQPLLLNFEARQRLAASHASSVESSVALAVGKVLMDAESSLLLAGGLLDVRILLDGMFSSVIDAGADACVSLLAAEASESVQAEVHAAAETAFQTARLSVRLQGATTAESAAGTLADYRADVRASVESMIAVSGSTGVDAEVLTELFIAASAGAYIGS